MKKEILEDAIISALSFLNDEVESVEIDDLKTDYLNVIEKLELALGESRKSSD